MPKISIIVPVYNAARWLDACVESILAQSFADWECILVNDGSIDESPGLCNAWAEKDSRIRVLHKANGGPSTARRAGVEMAQGEFLTFIDSDDTIDPHYLEKLYDAITEYDADIAACNFCREHKDGTVVPTPGTELIPGVFTGAEICAQFMQVKVSLIILPAKLYHRSVLEKVNYPAEDRLAEDEAIAHQLLYPCRRVVCIPDILYHYIDHNSTTTNSARIFDVRLLDQSHAFLDRMRYFLEKKEPELFRDAAMLYAYSIYCSFGRMPAKKLKEFDRGVKALRREFAAEETAARRCKGLPLVHGVVVRLAACPPLLWLFARATIRFVQK